MKKYLLRHKWLTTTIAIPSLILALFLMPARWAEPPKDTDVYFNKIVGWFSKTTNNSSKLELLEAYCDTMSNADIQEWYIDAKSNWLYYTPKNSLFVQALCSWIGKSDTFYNMDLIKWKKRDAILGTNIKGCDWTFNNCDLSELLPALFNASMNDHSTLSIAWWAMNPDIDKTIQDFSITYFSRLDSTCWEKSSEYVSSKWAASSKNALCSHPSTYQALKSTIQWLQKQSTNLRIVEWKWFWGELKAADCAANKYDKLFECSYTNSTTKDAWQYQYNLWYNELLYYKLLISWLTNNKLLNPNIKPVNLTQNVTVSLSDEIQNLKREEILSDNALQIMQKTINNIRATLPLHVWLQAYYEDVVTFRQSLAKVYTPIHQLNYKLRNIQEKK
jgi:hypothetical protein